MFDVFSYRDRTGSMVHTVGERYDTNVRMNDTGGAFTDTKAVTVLSPEYFIKMGVPRRDAEDLAMYVAGHEGAHTRCSDTETLTKGMMNAKRQGYDPENLNHFLQITEDVRVDYDTIKRRPGFALLRSRGDRALLKVTFDKVSGNKIIDTAAAVSCLTYGTDLRDEKEAWTKAKVDWELAYQMRDKIMSIVDMPATTSSTSMAIAKECYDMMFGKPKSKKQPDQIADPAFPPDDNTGDGTPNDDDVKGDGNKPGDNDEEGDSSDDSYTDDDEDGDDDTDDEDGDDTDDSDGDAGDDDCDDDGVDDATIEEMVKSMVKAVPGIMSETDKERFDNIVDGMEMEFRDFSDKLARTKDRERHYGTKVLSPEEDAKLFKYASDGTHGGVSLAYIKRKTETMADLRNGFYSRQNLEFYTRDKELYDGQAKQLARKLIQDLRAAKDPEGYVSDNGIVIAGKAWQPERTGNGRVFNKEAYEEVGDYVIDVLLDASGSQSRRRREVAVQGVVLAEAFSMAGIPCQVTQFNRMDSSSVVRQLRDYDEPRDANIHVLGFEPNGDNRDGHAIRCVEWCIRRRPETNKVIIVLSDGAPADSSAGRTSLAKMAGAMEFYVLDTLDPTTGMTAIDDVAINVRRIRAGGIALLGVYTGDESNQRGLKAEQTMYGNDFAFIPNINDFAMVVGNYLHRSITKM